MRRGDTYVEVFNNSGISGLAGSTAARAQGAGWQVVGSDNWYGTIAASTVYYPARLHGPAKLLGKDLGIDRLKPAIAPMRGDRLTVILTARLLLSRPLAPSGWLAAWSSAPSRPGSGTTRWWPLAGEVRRRPGLRRHAVADRRRPRSRR